MNDKTFDLLFTRVKKKKKSKTQIYFYVLIRCYSVVSGKLLLKSNINY